MLQQIFDLLTTATGNLAYHLVLAFSLLGALQMAIPYRNEKPGKNPHFGRMIFGLLCLLALQMGQFIFSGLAWQGMIDGAFWLPPADRGVMLLSLVVVIWLWLLPEKDSVGDAATSILVILLLVGLVYSVSWWRNQYPNLAYNSSWADFVIQLVAIFLIVSGGILLSFRRPVGWQMGLIMFGLLLLGPVLHLFIPLKGGDYSGAVRASQLAAFPLLFLLIYRWQEQKPLGSMQTQPAAEIKLDPDAPTQFVNLETWQALAQMAGKEPSQASTCEILSTLARLSGAQACLLATASDADGMISIQTGFDQNSEADADPIRIEARIMPLIATALQNEKVERLAVNAYSPDTLALGKALRLDQASDILFVPLHLSAQKNEQGLLLLFAGSLTKLSAKQYSALQDLALIVAYFLQQYPAMQSHEIPSDRIGSSAQNSDLRVALEEIVALRTGLADAEQRIAALRVSTSPEQTRSRNLDGIVSIVQDLRHPITSITNSADTLINETSSNLDESKRKRLERIKVSTVRLSYLVNELFHMVNSGPGIEKLAVSEINLNFLITRILEEAKKDNLAKEISVNLDLPLQPLTIQTDYQLLEKALAMLVQNAVSVSPAGSTINVIARLEHKEGSPDYILIQISDRGGGIDLAQFSRGFIQPESGGTRPVMLEKPAMDYASLKILIDSLGGRIWVDNEPGKGAIFSLLIPVAQEASLANKGEGNV